MEYFFHKLPIELRMDGRTGAVTTVSGYVEIIPDVSVIRSAQVSNWTLGHVMIVCGDQYLFADAWVEAQIKQMIMLGERHVDAICNLWGNSQRDMREGFRREAAYA